MSKGIYCFVDKKINMVVYIGKDSNIDKRRRIKDHYYPSNYDKQPFNRVLQNNSNRYESKIICEYPDLTDDELNYLEIKEILKHKFLYDEIPKFNFTIGGDGQTGHRHTEEAKRKISESHTGKQLSNECKEKAIKNLNHSSGDSSNNWKNYARIIKWGFNKNKQNYSIRYNGKYLKSSVYVHKLYKWFAENFPNEYLYFEAK